MSQTAQTVALVVATLVAALLGVVVGFLLTSYQQRRQTARDDRIRNERAIADLLAAALDLMVGARALRSAHLRRTKKWRLYLGLAGEMFVAVPELTTVQVLTEHETLRSMAASALRLWRDQTADERMVALDSVTVLVPRVVRFMGAVALVALGEDEVISDAVRAVTPKVYALLGSLAAHDRNFAIASVELEKALETFRANIDKHLAKKN